MNIVLIGMPGSGAREIGLEAARATGMALRDTDEIVRQSTGMMPRELFGFMGEGGYREVEAAACRLVTDSENTVIRVGSGALLREANRQQLHSCGPLVFLEKAPEALSVSAAEEEWPPLRRDPEALRRLWDGQIALCRESADHILRPRDDAEAARELTELILRLREEPAAPEKDSPELEALAAELDDADRALVAAFSRRVKTYRRLAEARRARGIAADEAEEDRLVCDAALRRVTMDLYGDTFALMRCVLAASKRPEDAAI